MNADRPATPILDVRPAVDFEMLHHCDAATIPLEELDDRTHELPPRDTPLTIFDVLSVRAERAADWLRARERRVHEILYGESFLRESPTQSGPARVRLWQAHRLLIEALELMRLAWGDLSNRTALDVACGSGRDAVQLALVGYRVHARDILPDALAKCTDLARRSGVHLQAAVCDVESPLNDCHDQYDVVCCFNFLHRPLMPWIRTVVRPGGFVVYETFVSPQRELFGKPARPQHVLMPGELPTYFADFEIVVTREGLTGPRRMAASLIARRPT